MSSYHLLPTEVVSDVVGAFAEPDDIIARRKLGPAWFERYLQTLPSVAGDPALIDRAFQDQDEELLIDILTVRGGDLGDTSVDNDDIADRYEAKRSVGEERSDDNPNVVLERSPTMRFLIQAADAKLSQAFGQQLLTFPTFTTNLTITYWLSWSWIDRTEGSGNFGDHEGLGFDWMSRALLYFDAMAKHILLPIVRRQQRTHILFYVPEPTDVNRILDFMERYRVPLARGASDGELIWQDLADRDLRSDDPEWQPVIDRFLSLYPESSS